MVSEKKLRKMARFFCEELFGIKLQIPVFYFEGTNDLADFYNNRVLGSFTPGNCMGLIHDGSESKILINKRLADKELELTDAIIHELTHYYLWYLGYDYDDSERDFINKAKKLGISQNGEIRYGTRDEFGEVTKNYNFEKLQEYLNMYKAHERERRTYGKQRTRS